MANHCETYQREILPKVRKAEMSLLYTTRHLVLFYIPTKFIQIVHRLFDLLSGNKVNGLSLSNITKGDNAQSKKGSVFILVCDTSSGPVLQVY